MDGENQKLPERGGHPRSPLPLGKGQRRGRRPGGRPAILLLPPENGVFRLVGALRAARFSPSPFGECFSGDSGGWFWQLGLQPPAPRPQAGGNWRSSDRARARSKVFNLYEVLLLGQAPATTGPSGPVSVPCLEGISWTVKGDVRQGGKALYRITRPALPL